MTLTNEQKKAYRAIGHSLTPIVIIAGNGLSDSVMEELDRALNDHELIKIKIAISDRQIKQQVIHDIIHRTQSTLVQQIGKVALLLRHSSKVKPQLSNLRPV